jgi:uncharacterized membrane protein
MSNTPSPPRDAGDRPGRTQAAWGAPAKPESRWAPRIAVVVAIVLYIRLPGRYTVGPVWLIPALEVAILVALFAAAPLGMARWQRSFAVTLIAILSAANFWSLILLVRMLAYHGRQVPGTELLNSSINIWVTNVIVFGLWYWELDRGGPDARLQARHEPPDFLFPQMVTPACARPEWSPKFVDYLYVAFTNATAFSPTDTMPLTRWAKMLMLVQSLVSILAVTLVAARAVNILT